MSLITPTPIDVPPRGRPYSNITPFTERDSWTYLRTLEELRAYIRKLTPELDGEILAFIEEIDKQLETLIASVNISLENQANDVNTVLEVQTQEVDAKIASLVQTVNETVEFIVENSIEANDPVVKALLDDGTSATRIASDALYADKGTEEVAGNIAEVVESGRLSAPAVAATVREEVLPVVNSRGQVSTSLNYKRGLDRDNVGYDYTVARIHTHGEFIPGLLSKEFSLGYERQGTSGPDFKPPETTPYQQWVYAGGSLIANASAWRISGNLGELRGAQIKNGIIYHDMSNEHGQEAAAIGYRRDGTLKCYSWFDGDTAASMVADGVTDSWSWGPQVVKDGYPVDLTTNPIWLPFIERGRSGRQILGQSATGDIILITIWGITESSGLRIDECGALAIAEGCNTALVLDGGGSAQTLVNGIYAMPSSNTSGERGVGDFVVFNPPMDSNIMTEWVDIPLRANYMKNGTSPFRVRAINDQVMLDGVVRPVTGNFGATDAVVGDIPPRFRHNFANPRTYLGVGQGILSRKVSIGQNGTVNIVSSSDNTPSYISVDSVTYPRR